ncbi:MAG: hypothetical protein KDD48_06400 [Bdellovibrionales bacterium]|nr:hypothetical protein [Bdellovibrionales bacterium]
MKSILVDLIVITIVLSVVSIVSIPKYLKYNAQYKMSAERVADFDNFLEKSSKDGTISNAELQSFFSKHKNLFQEAELKKFNEIMSIEDRYSQLEGRLKLFEKKLEEMKSQMSASNNKTTMLSSIAILLSCVGWFLSRLLAPLVDKWGHKLKNWTWPDKKNKNRFA